MEPLTDHPTSGQQPAGARPPSRPASRARASSAPLLLALIFAAVLGHPDVGLAASDGRTAVKLMGWGDTTTMAKYALLERAFEEANPGIDLVVEILDMISYNRKLPVMIASGTAPDIFEAGPERSSSFASYASKDAYIHLGPLVERDGVDLSQWFDTVIENCHYEGRLFLLPKKLNTPSNVHYNMDLFDAAGLPYPTPDWTWDEARALARKLTRDFDGDGRVDQWGLAWPFAQGYEGPTMRGWTWTRNEGREINLDDPLFYETMQWMADLINVDHVAPSLEETKSSGGPGYLLFTTGKVAMQSGGRWQTAIYKREIGDRFRWDTVWMPVPEKGGLRRYQMNSEAWGIYRQSRHVEAAWKVIKWLAGPDGSAVLGSIGGAIPAVKSVAYSPGFLDAGPPSRAGNLMWLEGMQYAVLPPRGPEWAKIEQMMTQTLELGWNGQRTFRELALQLKPRIDRILQEEPSAAPRGIWGVAVALLVALGGGSIWWRRRGDRPAGRPIRSYFTSKLLREEAVYGWLFVAPHVVGLSVFTVGAILASGYLSLTQWDLFGAPRWVGAGNFERLVEDEIFWKALGNTVYYAGLRVPLSLLLSLGVALLMNLKIRGILWWRVIYFVPAVSSSVAIALVWRWIYSKDFGILNAFLSWFGVAPLNWLTSETLAMPAIIVMSVWWSVGTNMLIYLAALQGVPEQLYEAAELDGAGTWGQFRHVTFPMITPTTFFLLILGTIGSLQIFDIFYVMTQGGPNYATTSLVMYVFQNAFEYLEMGYASAVAWVLFFIILLLSLVQLRFSGWVHYEGERQ